MARPLFWSKIDESLWRQNDLLLFFRNCAQKSICQSQSRAVFAQNCHSKVVKVAWFLYDLVIAIIMAFILLSVDHILYMVFICNVFSSIDSVSSWPGASFQNRAYCGLFWDTRKHRVFEPLDNVVCVNWLDEEGNVDLQKQCSSIYSCEKMSQKPPKSASFKKPKKPKGKKNNHFYPRVWGAYYSAPVSFRPTIISPRIISPHYHFALCHYAPYSI
jgi:hypothetical protein